MCICIFYLILYSLPSLLNRCKEKLAVNGLSGKVKCIKDNTIFIQSGTSIIPVFKEYADGQKYHPIVAGYAPTIHKVMGQTLSHVTLVFDMRVIAIGYVALSRVSSLGNVPLLQLRKAHFINL